MSRYPEAVDVVIVGSGPTGAAYARILSEEAPGSTLALFEVGPTVSSPPGAHVKNIEDPVDRADAQERSEGPGAGSETVSSPGAVTAGQRRGRPGTYLLDEGYQAPGEDGMPVAAFSSNVGGMGAHWTGACPRPGDSERIAFLPDLDDLLDEADRLLAVTTDAFDNAPFTALVRERLAAAVDDGRPVARRVQRMPLAVHRRDDGRLVWSGSDVVFGDETRANPHFTLYDESLVTRVLLADGRAAGVEVRDRRTGDLHTVRARFVVVAADALRTPQVLWASGIRPTALGRMLNDQTQVVYATRIRDAAEVAAAERAAEGATGGSVGADEIIDGAISERSGVSWVPFTDAVPFHGQVMQLDASPIPLADDDPVVPGSIVGLGLFCAKDLQWDDRVAFADDELDWYGMPAMRLHYTLTDRDRAVVERAQAEIVELAKAVGDPIGDRPFTMPLGASLHYQGSVRMGETDDGRSVCSPDSEVWEAPGVFVAGNGVIPTATACNPTLTSVALAVKGARRIARELSDAEPLLMQQTNISV
ncbi:GMC family oxidoreductase N-terminal domain-containing protein [Leifsonia shinshuensis]|uniref:GMC oxidoreductase n=1 Tax=Leifsonia shinshuensis TaxID=150026 RepID=UPI001F50EA9B|nr:GMC oxidoreductase [Leifsonia shinshuensis]MCI0157546.1 GMC family oxidoreductase N-terminal domain-containing protein [Leifsonia shinshuensis]